MKKMCVYDNKSSLEQNYNLLKEEQSAYFK